MDIKLEKKPWYIRYRYYLAGGVAFLAFLIYVVTLSLGPSKLRIEQDNIQIAEVKNGKFMEYVDVEGVIQPILTIKVNAREAGSVERIIGEEGSLLRQGDTILVMENPDLLRSIEDQRDDWEKQLITYREKEIEMEQKSLNLQQQALQTDYDLNRLRKSFALDKEEYRMGIKSKAQLEVSEDEYNYKVKNAHLQRESLRHDSAVTVIRKDLIRNDRERERKKYERACERLGNLVVKAPVAGQLSFVKEELARREALLAQREAQLEKEQAELAAAKAQSAERKKTLLDNNDPNFVNPKEKLYDKFPLTVHQMDIIIGVLFALILLFLVLGMTHTSFFGLFGG